MQALKSVVVSMFLLAIVAVINAQTINLDTNFHIKRICGSAELYDSEKIATVIVCYAPQCPICIAQTKTLQALYDSIKPKGVNMILIYPGGYYSKGFIRKFQKQYKLKITAFLDKSMELTNALNATVTPQAFVIDSSGKLQYSGKIDNWFEDIGKRRTVITEFYLLDAVNAILEQKEPKVKQTVPVGCFIN